MPSKAGNSGNGGGYNRDIRLLRLIVSRRKWWRKKISA